MKKGFTLVELAIVLVIIGLLIGGILVTQSMMDTYRILAQVRQFQQFDIAVSNFKVKFGGLPADNTVFGGNGDGVISSTTTGQAFGQVGEYDKFWPQLSSTQTLVDGYNYHSGACNCNGDFDVYPVYNIPISALYGKTQIGSRVDGNPNKSSGVLAYGATDNKNYYTITGPARIFEPLEGLRVVKPAQLQAIDSKMDNGNPLTGTVVARISFPNNIVNDPGLASNGAYHDDCVTASGAVNMSSLYCVIRVEMLSQTDGSL